ncbi:hypothetical protein GOP47_0001580 [Adiantum capillus-veneris]|uniref:Uncharacterized protein n=1 Tax=Adiantum capillus-veneris TaxID=13818 RepID=A0A9D4VAB9_ADICA|nr:hypothetical protein GOP47_0001580 [Adiantum capillus-veneris]
MASAVIRTYERKPGFSRNNSMKKPHNALNGYGLDSIPPERSYTSETVADSSEIRRARSKVTAGPCVAQNFTTISAEAPSDTASEDSCSLKRKSMSLNGDKAKDIYGYGGSLRDLSRGERRQLRKRIKLDLQQVSCLTMKIEAREMEVRSFLHGQSGHYRSGMNGSMANGHYFPTAAESFHREGRISRQPSLVIPEHSFDGLNSLGKDKRTPKANQLYASSDFLSGKEKLPPPEKNRPRPGVGVKRNLHGRNDSRDPKRSKMMDFSYTKRVSELLKQCGVLLKKLMSHKFGWVFNEPVDVVKLNLHDYFKIIKRPMDLGTIKKKMDTGLYLLPTEFCDDVRLTFSNAMKYNPQGHDVYLMADTLRGIFETKWKTMEEKVKELDSFHDRFVDLNSRDHQMGSVEQSVPPIISQLPAHVSKPAPARKSKPPSTGKSASKPKSKPVQQSRRPMTFAEKQQLSEALGNLPPEKLDQAVQIMRKNPNLQQNDDEIEVDIESFDPETLWELHRFVMDCKGSIAVEDKPAPVAHQGPSEHQTSNCVTKSAKPISKGNEVGEEEVDIGDDMPAKEFPPVVIEKDRVLNAREGSSSSSSSSSGSSSSDSDSGSSSGSDSDADEAHSAGAASKFSSADKEPVGSAAVGDQRGSPTFVEDGVKRPLDNAPDENPASKSPGSDFGPQSEGKGEACHERQARAALLRSRFAETILKAQEKTLPLSKSDNPEKLRKEQEELERRRKEEKARLHAEARAVELQRKKAELAAAAEAKQRREAEREAARLALQNMEKTVEIDESMEVLKDLERLRSGPPEHIPSSGDETSPVHSPGRLSSFAFEGSNPLERLGLFMRSDEEEEQEEEQEVDPALAPHSSS